MRADKPATYICDSDIKGALLCLCQNKKILLGSASYEDNFIHNVSWNIFSL